MRARTLLILCTCAAALAAKERAWQTGQLLDKAMNPYFKTVPAAATSNGPATTGSTFVAGDNGIMAVSERAPEGNLTYENYVIQGAEMVYLVEYQHFKTFPAPNVSKDKPLTFAIEKNKLIILDSDRREFDATILKQVDRRGNAVALAAPAAKTNQPKVEQAKVEQPKADKAKPQSSKPDSLFARAALSNDDLNPSKTPAPVAATAKPEAQPAVQAQPAAPAPKPEPKVEASVTKPVQKPQPKVEAAVTKPVPKVTPKPEPKVEATVTKHEPEPKPERPTGPVARASTKDRAWQSGQLLSVANNNYFFNVTYTSDLEGSSWPFSQGSDGRMTVTGQIAANTESPYTYDNYVVESQFVAYLVQRMRPKTSPAVRFPGTHPLKFAVEKNKMYIIDDQGIEYETKVVKLIQKDAIVDPLARAAAR
jgi:hypothetical protein